MMRSTLRLSSLALIIVCAGSGCGRSSTAPAGGTFQIASAVASPTVAECGLGAHAAYQTAYSLHLVNTTLNDATVTGVSSTGIVIRSTRPEEVGMAWNTFPSLPFSPSLVASDDYLDMTVTLSSSCLPHPPITADEFRDVSTTLVITTGGATMGVYASRMITTTIHYSNARSSIRATPR